jgi:hypothetical protein
MAPTPVPTAALLLVFTAGVVSVASISVAQQTPRAHEIPVSIQLDHQQTLAALDALARRAMARKRDRVAETAGKALELVKAHMQREQEYILPPLTLLPVLANGRVTADMRWALEMADRVKADREIIYQEHARITQAMTDLLNAAVEQRDSEAAEFARSMVADSLSDLEVTEPMVETIGEYLRTKLPGGR